MEMLRHLLTLMRDPQQLILWGGYLGLLVIVFAETGLLVGFVFPGDSLLVTAGLLTATQAVHLNLLLLVALLIPTAIIGDAVGYAIGLRAGRRLLERPDGRFVKRTHLLQTQAFYERHGGKTIVLARFVPIVRTFAPVIAGIARMPYHRFAAYNILGAAGWVGSMLAIGYFLGRVIPGLSAHIELLAMVIIGISLLPLLIEYLRHRRGGDGAVTVPGDQPTRATGPAR